jgi:hypothetical protein
MSDWFDDYCFGWSNIPTCEFYRWLESNSEALEIANSCTSAQELHNRFALSIGEFSAKDINWQELYETLTYEG